MSYTEDDAARDAFYEEISQELYPEHKEQAIEEFTRERLRSFYIQHPDVMRPAVDALREGMALYEAEHHSAAVVFFASAIELLLKATLLRPVVYGLVHRDGLAEIIVDQTLGPAPFNRYQKLMAHLFVELAGIDIKVVSRDSVSMPLLSECTEIQKLRNNIVHRGSQCTSEQAESGAKVSRAAYELIVVPMLRSLGLTVVERGAIVPR